jgi:hypothetical protein
VVAVALLGVIAVLLGLMVFVPQLAPLKLGATRLAAGGQVDQEVETVAKRFAANFLTISYRTLDEDFERVLEDSTGSLRTRLLRAKEVSQEPLTEAKAISRGRVTDVTLFTRRGDTATAQAVVRRSIENADTPEPRTLVQTLQLTLVRTAAGWKVADTSESPSPNGAQPDR